MASWLVAGAVLQSILAVSTIEGQVVGPDNRPIAQAQVFLEPGLEGFLQDTITSESGHFQFSDVSPGGTGIFALAPGYGFGGQHVDIAVGDEVPRLLIVLREARTIEGKIVDHKGGAVSGARVTRIGVKGAHKVGIPLAKLRQYGYAEPVSNESGHFRVPSVPAGSTIDLKVGHGSFAQEGVLDVPAGATGVTVTMYPGVLVEGDVMSRSNQLAVGQANVLIRNAQPPYDTATTRSNLQGRFSLRLKPGVYLYQAEGAGMRSPGWERLAITGERPVEHVRLSVAGTGVIFGNVRDAISGNPVRGVRISLTTNGSRAAVMRTGSGGDFKFVAGEGENIIQLDSTPGYFPPDTQHVKVTVLEGNDVELPGMWLKPLPAYQITVVDAAQNPVPGALVSVLHPQQFGWHVADAQGLVDIRVQAFPADGTLLGRAEHPTLPQVAVFRLDQHTTGPGAVQLFDAATVSGTIVNGRGKGLAGVSVGAFFPGASAADAILLWQTFSGPDGQFRWPSAVPGVPQRCAARAPGAESGESATFNLTPGEDKSLGEIVVDKGQSGESLLGTSVSWYTWDLLSGSLPEKAECARRPALLVYTSAEDVAFVMESLAQIKIILDHPDLLIAIVSDGTPDGLDPTIPVVSGTPVGSATTRVLDRQGNVIFESSGTPPVHLLRNL